MLGSSKKKREDLLNSRIHANVCSRNIQRILAACSGRKLLVHDDTYYVFLERGLAAFKEFKIILYAECAHRRHKGIRSGMQHCNHATCRSELEYRRIRVTTLLSSFCGEMSLRTLQAPVDGRNFDESALLNTFSTYFFPFISMARA